MGTSGVVRTIASGDQVSLRPIVPDDAQSYLSLVTDPLWTRFIGETSLRTTAHAEAFITSKIQGHYKDFGYGLWAVIEREQGSWAGVCGSLRRDWLEHPDLGFALLPDFRRRGFARSACELTLQWMRQNTDHRTLQAILTPDNEQSKSLLQVLGFLIVGDVTSPSSAQELLLMQIQF